MNIKKLVPLIAFLISLSFYGQGENMREKKEQIRTMKVAFLTSELELSSSEAQKFWPIYNDFDDKQFELRHQKMRAFNRKMDKEFIDRMTEKEASTLITQMENTEEELLTLRKKLVVNLRAVIPSIKILKLKKAEEDFSRKLLHQYRDKAHKK